MKGTPVSEPLGHPLSATVETTDEFGRRVVRKVSRRLLPFMVLLYVVNYLDRTNIGFAKLTMNADLGMSETAFGLASGLFFVGYLFFEVPSNLALHRFGARRWMARILLTWGVIATSMAFVSSHGWVYALRILLGVAEAGFFPGMILYLTYWMPRRERARATALFMAAIPLSSAVGAMVSSTIIQYLDGLFGLAGWRVLFLLEGLPAVVLAGVTWYYLTDRPAQAAWLSEAERNWLIRTLEREDEIATESHDRPLRRSLTDPRVLGLGVVYFGITYGSYALNFFLPTIVAGFAQTFDTHYSIMESGLIVSVPYAVAAVAMVLWSRHSDRTGERLWHVVAPTLLGAAGVPAALYLNSPFLVMAAVTVTAVGVYAALPVFWYLPTNFLSGAGAAGGIAVVSSLGNTSGFGAPYLTGRISDANDGDVAVALWVVGAMMLMAALLILALRSRVRPSPPDRQPSAGRAEHRESPVG